ncbi:MAG: hypothetical protein QXV77_03830 [Candidatus Bathyarchaeia archaeon]
MWSLQRGGSKPRLSKGRREIREIIETCKAVEERRLNPFFIDIGNAIEILRLYYPLWRSLEDFSMDAEVLKGLSRVLALQNSQLLYRSTRLYADPEIISSRLKRLTTAKLAEIFLRAFHPAIEMEQITGLIVLDALSYWGQMTPYSWRSRSISLGGGPRSLSMEEAEAMGISGRKGFHEELEEIEAELRAACLKGYVEYSRFIRLNAQGWAEMVERAYLLSFLLNSGTASLKRDEEGKLWLWIPSRDYRGEVESVPIPVKAGDDPHG